MNKNPLVSIIIVTWNGKDNLLECINSLKKISYKNVEYITVDNGSMDGTIEAISNFKSPISNLKIIRNTNNLGYAEGNNIGFKAAKGELVLFLNNDTLVEPDFLNPLVNKLTSDKAAGAVQSKILNYPEKDIIDSVGSYFITSGFLYHYGHNKRDEAKYNIESEIFSMKGACMLFKKKVIDEVGLFENSYFAYFEESDLCMRTLLAGYKIFYIPQSVIYHKGGNTAGKLPGAFIQFHAYKNRIYTYLKNFQTITLLKIMPVHIILNLIVCGAFFARLQFPLGFAVLKGIVWNIKNITLILRKRKYVNSKIRKLKDSDYLPSLTRPVRFSYYIHLFTTSLAGYKD